MYLFSVDISFPSSENGLYEVAQAAGLSVRLEKKKIVLEHCVKEIDKYFSIDPFWRALYDAMAKSG
jgi:hypothetical protein